ncbi:DNA-binding protein snt1, partial [Coemansia aciculifera]
MSFNRQQQSESQNAATSGSGVRQHRSSGSGSRDRSTGRQPHILEGGGVVRDRMRSGSVDRAVSSTSSQSLSGGGDGRSGGYARSSQLGRWAGHDIWYRDDNDRERSSWDGRVGGGGRRDRDYPAAPNSARYSGSGSVGSNQQQASLGFGSSRHSVGGGSFGRDRAYTPPSFARRATEPGEVLEDGELEIDDRNNSKPPPGLGGRTFTLPLAAEANSSAAAAASRRTDAQSLGVRTESRRPSSVISAGHGPIGHHHQHHHQHPTHHPHSGVHQQPRLAERKFSQPLARPPPPPPLPPSFLPPPPPPPPPMAMLMAMAPKPVLGGGRDDGDSPRTPTPEPVRAPVVKAEALPKAKVPALEAQSRITDIDREIAECQERLVLMNTPPVSSGDAGNDRAVPEKSKAAEAKEQQAVPQTGEAKHAIAAADELSGDDLSCDDVSGDDLSGDALKDRRRSQAAVRRIYAENHARAAAVQATMAAPFLAAYPCFVPGAYPAPSDWPFWAEAERSHARMRPFLAEVLAREKRQNAEHARKLQGEYADLYARWRRRVDRLDRQREARQRTASGGAPSVAGRRRAAGSAAGVALADEFGFSLGPLFSATPAAPDVRGDDGAFTSDAVHSEAELMAIIARLQHDDARSPDARSQRTAAAIPDMVVGARDRELLRFANSCHSVADAPAFYHAQLPAAGAAIFGNNGDGDHVWTQAEVGAFVAAYLTHPKEFGVIAACVPHKSMNACVQFYYRNKKQLRLKALEAKANRRARRQQPSARRRKDKDRKKREERERIAQEAAAQLAQPEPADATDDADDDDAAAVAGALERRSRSSALVRSIVQASRRRPPPILVPVHPADSDASDDEARGDMLLSPPPTINSAATTTAQSAVDVVAEEEGEEEAEEEDGELVEDARWEPRRRGQSQQQQQLSEPNVRLRRSHGDSDQSLSEASNDSPSQSRAVSPPLLPLLDDVDEVVEASGVVRAVLPFPRIVSRKSQSRFDVTLTANLDIAVAAAAAAAANEHSPPPTESALDRHVTDDLSAHRRPISSYETLLICSSAATNSPTRANSSGGLPVLTIDTSVAPAPALPILTTPLDVQVDLEAGSSESVLVGAAAWLRDDRRRVLRALHRLGADFAQVASLMPSKTMAQCRYFYYHYRTPAGALISD